MDTFEETNAPIKPASSYISVSMHDAVKLRIGKQGLAAMPTQTIPQFFHENCEKYADYPALAYKAEDDTHWTTVTFAEYEQKVDQVTLMLLHVGLQPRSSVGILSFNCPEWFYTELATLRAGGVVAGIYPSSSPESVFHILDTSDATICVVDNSEQMAKVRTVKGRLPRLRAVIQLHGPYEEIFSSSDQGFYRWEDLFCMQFRPELRNELQHCERDVAANECALLIFTSGTTGMPKGAMISHDSVLYDCKAFFAGLPNIVNGKERVVSYLPLNHVAAQLFDIFFAILSGSCVYFADRNALKGSIFKTYQQVKPTVLFGVPRIFEKLRDGLLASDDTLSPIARCITCKARKSVEQYYLDLINGKPASKFKYWLGTRITNQIKIALGVDQAKYLFAGGAPVSEDLKHFFLSIDLPISEVFGMTESSGAASGIYELSNLQTVGKALEGIEIKIDNPDCNGHGEICIRGRTIFMGYLNNIENTKEAIKEDGFCYTGDLGYLDTDGNLYITGRIKELIITAGGENIPPVHIEDCIKKELPIVSNAMVVGDRRKYLTVLLTLKTEVDAETGFPNDNLQKDTIEWLEGLGLNFNKLSEVLNYATDIDETQVINTPITLNAKITAAIDAAIKRANNYAQSNAQKVQKFAILPHDFSISTGEIGPTMKIRRQFVAKKYAKIIELLYQ